MLKESDGRDSDYAPRADLSMHCASDLTMIKSSAWLVSFAVNCGQHRKALQLSIWQCQRLTSLNANMRLACEAAVRSKSWSMIDLEAFSTIAVIICGGSGMFCRREREQQILCSVQNLCRHLGQHVQVNKLGIYRSGLWRCPWEGGMCCCLDALKTLHVQVMCIRGPSNKNGKRHPMSTACVRSAPSLFATTVGVGCTNTSTGERFQLV